MATVRKTVLSFAKNREEGFFRSGQLLSFANIVLLEEATFTMPGTPRVVPSLNYVLFRT